MDSRLIALYIRDEFGLEIVDYQGHYGVYKDFSNEICTISKSTNMLETFERMYEIHEYSDIVNIFDELSIKPLGKFHEQLRLF